MDLTEDDAQPHSLWLLPEKQALAVLQGIIRDIAGRQGSPAFMPHVTLIGELSGAPALSVRACRECFEPLGGLNARVTSLSRDTPFFMSLFLDLALEPDITKTWETLCTALGAAPTRFRPHLSLAYGVEACEITAEEMHAINAEFAGADILLDRVAVVSSAQSIPIASWRVLHSLALRG